MFFMFLLLASCGSKKIPVVVERTDSVVIVKQKVVHVHDTIPFEIPSQTASNTTPEGHSFLENDFCWSTADVDSLGVLNHVLETKDRSIDIPIVKDSVIKDSVVYIDRDKPVPYPVERKLTWREKVCINMMPVIIIVFVVENVWLWLRKRRK